MADLIVDYNSTLFMCILYISMGGVAVFCSVSNLAIYLSSKELRSKYIYFMALVVGEMVDGISYILAGVGRKNALMGGFMTTPTTVYGCFFEHYWPHALILGTELPAYCTVLISLERICAVSKPVLYNRIFVGTCKLVWLAAVPILATISLLLAATSALRVRETVVSTQHCPIINSTSIWYSTYHFLLITLVFLFSFISIALIKWKTRNYASVRNGDSHLGLMLAVTGSSLFLVGSSSVVMLMIKWEMKRFNDVIVALTYSMPGFLSIVNTVLNLTFRKDIRNQLSHLLGWRSSEHIATNETPAQHFARHTNTLHHS